MLKTVNGQVDYYDVDDNRQKAGNDRKPGLIEGVKSGYQDFVCGISKQPDRIQGQGLRRCQGVFRGKGTVLENQPDNWLRKDDESGRGGEGQGKNHGEGRHHGFFHFRYIFLCSLLGQYGQHCDRQGNTENSNGQLYKSERIIEPGNGAFGTGRGKIGVDKNIDLGGG